MRRIFEDRYGYVRGVWIVTFLVALIALGFAAGRATAAPLSVRAHQANLYGGKLAIARVCVDLKVVKAERVELYVNGIGGGLPTVDGFPPIDGWEQWKGELRHYRLRPGHRHFCRSFDVEHLVFKTVPTRPGLPRSRWDHYVPTVVQSVYAELTVGGRSRSAEGEVGPGG